MREVEAYSRLAGIYDEIVVDPCYREWAGFLDRLWRTDPAGATRVLDVCCGTGLLAAELVARGYRVSGVDASSAMLARARHLLGPDTELTLATLPDLPVRGVFDVAVSTFDGLNYLGPDDFRLTLAAVAGQLRPGGWFVFDLHADAILDLVESTPVIEGEREGTSYRIRYSVDRSARTCRSRIEVTGGGAEPFTEHHLQYLHADPDVRAALGAAGLDLVAVTDEYTEEPAGEDTLRATWIARRPAASPAPPTVRPGSAQ